MSEPAEATGCAAAALLAEAEAAVGDEADDEALGAGWSVLEHASNADTAIASHATVSSLRIRYCLHRVELKADCRSWRPSWQFHHPSAQRYCRSDEQNERKTEGSR